MNDEDYTFNELIYLWYLTAEGVHLERVSKILGRNEEEIRYILYNGTMSPEEINELNSFEICEANFDFHLDPEPKGDGDRDENRIEDVRTTIKTS